MSGILWWYYFFISPKQHQTKFEHFIYMVPRSHPHPPTPVRVLGSSVIHGSSYLVAVIASQLRISPLFKIWRVHYVIRTGESLPGISTWSRQCWKFGMSWILIFKHIEFYAIDMKTKRWFSGISITRQTVTSSIGSFHEVR